MKKTTYKYGIIAAVLWILFVLACASVRDQWQQASSVNSIEAYETFLAKNPRSEYSSEARSRHAGLVFEQAKRTNSIATYQEFLSKYGDTPSATEARERLATLAFKECKKENTLQSYTSFIEKYKGTHAAKEASDRLDNLIDWSSIKQLVQEPLKSNQKSIKLEGLSSSYSDLQGLQWTGPQPAIPTWLGLRLQDVDESYKVTSFMQFYWGIPIFKAKYPKGIIMLPNGSTVEIYSHPADQLKFSWGNLKGLFVAGKGWEFGPFIGADVLEWTAGRGIVVLKNRGETIGISFGVE